MDGSQQERPSPREEPQGNEADDNARNRRPRRRGNNSNNHRGNPGMNKYKGKCDDIDDHIYGAALPHENQDLFSNTTREIAECVAREYTKAGEFRIGMVQLQLPVLTPPTAPDSKAGLASVEMYKLDLKAHHDKVKNRATNMEKVYSLVLGQCSRTIRDRLEADSNWSDIDSKSDVMSLLALIRQCLYTRATTRHPTHTLIDAEMALYKFRQGDKMTNSEYLEKLKGLVDVLDHLGSPVGVNQSRINTYLSDPNNADADEIKEATSRPRDEYLACLLIVKSDHKRYGSLVAELENSHTCRVGGYPETISRAYDMLVNYKVVRSGVRRGNEQETGVSFYTQEDNPHGRGAASGHGGRGSHGRGGGRGYAGRGRGQHNETHQAHVLEDNNNNESDSDYSVLVYDMTNAECYVQSKCAKKGKCLPANWLLGDSCSTINILSNKEWLHGIHTSTNRIAVHCNAGTIYLDKKAYFGNYPEPVWYNPHGIANIMSLGNIAKHYRVTMDTDVKNEITVHTGTNNHINFKPSDKGLYKCDMNVNTESGNWTMIQTVKSQSEGYSKRAVTQAKVARRLQNILMFPGAREMMDKSIHHLCNCPVTRADIIAAEEIYGPNLGALKGKTVRRNAPSARSGIEAVPRPIMDKHREVQFGTDIFFVNKIPFLLTMSRDLRFNTVEYLTDRKAATVAMKIKSVIKLYGQRGFRVVSIMADPEFESLEGPTNVAYMRSG